MISFAYHQLPGEQSPPATSISDFSDPGRFVETVLVESWVEHRRQFEQVTNADRAFEERVRAFDISSEPPKISQMIYAG